MASSDSGSNSLFRHSLERPILIPLVLLAITVVFRIIDIFFLPLAEATGEAFVHKVLGLLLILGYIWGTGRPLREIGVHGRRMVDALWIAVPAIVVVLILAFSAQMLVSNAAGDEPSLILTALDSRTGVTGGLGLALFLFLGNLINSSMEEGLFRGVMLTHFRRRLSPWRANLLQAAIFGLWHITWPIYHLVTGEVDLGQAASEGMMMVVGATISGLAYGTLYMATDNLWAPWLAHLVNNTILNLLHVQTTAGIDADLIILNSVLALGYLAVVPWTIFWAKRRRLPMVEVWGEGE
jgi:membrane protease YdiL (CAAX protease family)